jgi:hypothetical protein
VLDKRRALYTVSVCVKGVSLIARESEEIDHLEIGPCNSKCAKDLANEFLKKTDKSVQ